MTEKELRAKYVAKAKEYLGIQEGGTTHKQLVDTYNTINPLPVGYPLKYTDEWCAGFVSAIAQLCGLTDIILPECSCPRMITLYKNAGRWQESDSYTPQSGDLIMFNWDDTGSGDTTGDPEHVGIVVSCDGSNIVTIEGNKNQSVEYRELSVNGLYIRGYCLPDYASKASKPVTFVTGNRYLTQAEMETNALYIWDYLGARGWTRNAVAGMLGNMQTESTINPGIWQSLNEGVGPAFGLVQWDPFTKYTEWCEGRGLEPSHMDSALQRIEYELANGLQYYATDAYPLSFSQFKVSTESASYLAMAFLRNYERPADPNQPNRATQAEYWYTYLANHTPGTGGGGTEPDEPVIPERPWKPRSSKMSLLLLIASARRSGL